MNFWLRHIILAFFINLCYYAHLWADVFAIIKYREPLNRMLHDLDLHRLPVLPPKNPPWLPPALYGTKAGPQLPPQKPLSYPQKSSPMATPRAATKHVAMTRAAFILTCYDYNKNSQKVNKCLYNMCMCIMKY